MTELAGFTRRAAETRLPTRYGDFLAVGYQDPTCVDEHMALVYGDITARDPLTRVHSECLTGDVFASTRCECGDQLSAAMKAIVAEGAGILIYLQGHEGRGIGLLAKLKAMRLQEDGLDTVDANMALGLPVDCRDYQAAADILQDLNVPAIRLLSNNPHKVESLSQYGIRISEQVPLLIDVNDDNLPYLKAKRERLDHYLPQLDDLL
ncbi:GTP cyclohydrolase II [Kibdelosporangium philippinense]|uniref:GTP cyclohydrolase-2 n=1 Tax=Kibdelosporangium philippinense TaxID=211113 RepID=A0ABS8Z6H7_9PSEU|nr:GTP cyclohydrolase II [Kibdelosporangium philippinense]MCE7002649.1 GTP cyclohydrolase II [Kibdelosporangium philippinense]